MRSVVTIFASSLLLSAGVVAASADPQVAEPALTVAVLEHAEPVPVAEAPLPQPRPEESVPMRADRPAVRNVPVQRAAAVRQAVRPQAAAVTRPAPQQVALDYRSRSPLFWMTVGVGF